MLSKISKNYKFISTLYYWNSLAWHFNLRNLSKTTIFNQNNISVLEIGCSPKSFISMYFHSISKNINFTCYTDSFFVQPTKL